MEQFGERLAKLRDGKKLTQEGLAKILHISKSSLAMYEINKREPNIDTLVKIARYFGVSLDYLLTGKEPELREERKVIEVHYDPTVEIVLKPRK